MKRARVCGRREGQNVESMAAEAENHLPEPIIQHIQSFLGGKEAAQTSVLSKSWYAAWSTRPSLHLFHHHFRSTDQFAAFARTTLQRYRSLNLKVDTLTFSISKLSDVSGTLTDEILTNALKLGVNSLDLQLGSCILPVQVFSPSSLTRLSVFSCKIRCLAHPIVGYSRIASLNLRMVSVGDDAISDFFLLCPLLEDFEVYECNGFTKLDLSRLHNLKKVYVNQKFTTKFDNESLSVEFGDCRKGSFPQSRINSSAFPQLTTMVFDTVNLSDAFFCDFLVMFPCLEGLSLKGCYGYEVVKISSSSLKYLSLVYESSKRIQIDVTSIRLFKYHGGTEIPSLSFSNRSEKWKSQIMLNCWNDLDASWFSDLREFLNALKTSRIFLRAALYKDKCVVPSKSTPCSSVPLVENLLVTGNASQRSKTFLTGLCWSCHPKFITHEYALLEDLGWLYNILRPKGVRKRLKKLTCIHIPEEVNVELFDGKEWGPILWKNVLKAWETGRHGSWFRFQLKWPDIC